MQIPFFCPKRKAHILISLRCDWYIDFLSMYRSVRAWKCQRAGSSFCACDCSGFVAVILEDLNPPPLQSGSGSARPAKPRRSVGLQHLSPLVHTLIPQRKSGSTVTLCSDKEQLQPQFVNLDCDCSVSCLQIRHHGERLHDGNQVLPVPPQPHLLCEYFNFAID